MADITYNASGFVPHSAKADAWLGKMFAAIDSDLSFKQIETIASLARQAGFIVRKGD